MLVQTGLVNGGLCNLTESVSRSLLSARMSSSLWDIRLDALSLCPALIGSHSSMQIPWTLFINYRVYMSASCNLWSASCNEIPRHDLQRIKLIYTDWRAFRYQLNTFVVPPETPFVYRRQWLQGVKQDALGNLHGPLACRLCKGVLILGPASLKQHLASKKHIQRTKRKRDDYEPICHAKQLKVCHKNKIWIIPCMQ